MSGRRSGAWARIFAIFKKETIDHLRDRRALVLGMVYPLLGPILLAGGLALIGGVVKSDRQLENLDLPVVGAEHAPELMDYLSRHMITIQAPPEDPDRWVQDGRAPVILVVPPEAAGKERFTVTMLTDLSRVANVRATSRVHGTISGYNRRKAKLIAAEAGLPEDYASIIGVERRSVARPDNIAIFFYNMMPPLIMFMMFLAGVHIAIDTTAGERERGSLEPLLIAPVERWELLLAKAMMSLLMTALSVAVNLAAYDLLLGLAAERSDRLMNPPGHEIYVLIFVVSLPVMAVAVCLQMGIAVITRSLKEAQIYLGLLPLVPALPGMIMIFMPLLTQDWFFGLPILGQMMLYSRLVTGDGVAFWQILAAMGSTSALAALLFWQAARWFKREKMFFLG